jgi:3alpha(or 20beta)-hydroxysteroid dehydrogenase
MLQGKVGFITGAARGIGAATARRFVEEGARVVVADRREAEGQALVADLNQRRPDSALFVSLDIGAAEAWTQAIAATEAAFGRLDILINNASIIRVVPLEHMDIDTFRKVIDTNLLGTFMGLKAVIEPMKRAGGGSIVNFASVQGFEGRAGLAAYSASKFGIRALTKTAAIELGQYKIRVNTVVPGPTRTKMTERPGWSEADYDRQYSQYPLARMAEATEIAEMVVFLASDRASFCTGGDFVVDGGLLAGEPRDKAK